MNEKNEIYVWDLCIRLFHWSLVLLFVVAYATGDDKGCVHRYAGFMVMGLVIIRLVWGLIGRQHARFSDFMCSPLDALGYLRELLAGRPKYYPGHNPAAAWMILLFLANSTAICLSGYAAYLLKDRSPSLRFEYTLFVVENAYAARDGNGRQARRHERHEKGHGSLGNEAAESDSIWGDIHEASAQFMVLLIVLHVFGVALSSLMHHENLVKSMITGNKPRHAP